MKEGVVENKHKVLYDYVGYGHMGDGNLHINIMVQEKESLWQVWKDLEPWIWDRVMELDGSISAEHGIGWDKAEVLPIQQGETSIEMMNKLKLMFDPNGILNPYKVVLPKEYNYERVSPSSAAASA